MKVIEGKLAGLKIIEPRVFRDERGFFLESFQGPRYSEFGIPEFFPQDNVSLSQKGILRGLHFQNPCPQGKLITALQGDIFDVAVDLRRSSPTFLQHETFLLTGTNLLQVYIPPGFAHGFLTLSDNVLVQYKCTDVYNPQFEKSLLWNDPEIAIDWPITSPALSQKDRAGIPLKKFTEDLYFA